MCAHTFRRTGIRRRRRPLYAVHRRNGCKRPHNSASAWRWVQQAELELLNGTDDGAELALARLFAAMRLTPETTKSYDVFFEARSIVLPENIRKID
jgi:hypothetical protein